MSIFDFAKNLMISNPAFSSRSWSNHEIEKFAPLFKGKVVNVSAWQDKDKEGRHYKDYFTQAEEYWLTNFEADARGWQGNLEKEMFLDLEKDLPAELASKFDVVFNHTTLEHVFDVFKAMENLCRLSNDIVMLVVPFMQEQHGEYGDYWRFTPLCLKRLFKRNGFHLLYINNNEHAKGAVYVFAIASSRQDAWTQIRENPDNLIKDVSKCSLGYHSIYKDSFGKTVSRFCILCLLRLKRIIG
jgi:hypothetical protein